MFVEWYALKCFSLGAFITAVGAYFYFRYKYEVRHFEIDRVLKIKKP